VKLGGGREIERLTEHLWEAELVERMTTGTYGKGTGLVVLTDRAVIKNVDKTDGKDIVDLVRHRLSDRTPKAAVALRQASAF
jgi:hypothetical protein